MNLFDLKKGKILLTPQGLLIPEFKVLWDRDKNRNKEKALRDLSYVYFITDYKSPYAVSAPSDDVLSSMVAMDFMKKKKYNPDKEIEAAIKKYKELQFTPSMNLLTASIKTINNLTIYLENVDLQERDKSGKPIYKPSDVTNSLAKIGTIIESLNKVKDQVERETIKIGALRGQRKKGNREDPHGY